MASDVSWNDFLIQNDGKMIMKISRHTMMPQTETAVSGHDMLEFCWFLRGEAVCVIDNEAYPVASDDITLTYSGEPHCIQSKTEPVEFVVLWCNSKEILRNTAISEAFFGALKKGRENKIHTLDKNAAQFGVLRDTLAAILAEAETRENGCMAMALAQMQQFVILLMRMLADKTEEPHCRFAEKARLVDKTVYYILDHIAEEFTLEKLASIACLSPNYYGALFKKIKGITPWEFILKKRTELACDLLISSEKSVLEIAGECGFNTIANFNKAFKKYTGITPSAYKKRVGAEKKEE